MYRKWVYIFSDGGHNLRHIDLPFIDDQLQFIDSIIQFIVKYILRVNDYNTGKHLCYYTERY